MEEKIDNAMVAIVTYGGMLKDFIKQYPTSALIALFLTYDVSDVAYLALNHGEGPVLSIMLVVSLFLSACLIITHPYRPAPDRVPIILSLDDDDWFSHNET